MTTDLKTINSAYEIDRIKHPSMEYYRHVFSDSPRWSGENLEDKTVIVYMEQGYGDIIQFIRYVPILEKLGCRKIYIYCPKELHRLLKCGFGQKYTHLTSYPSHCINFEPLAVEGDIYTILDKSDPSVPSHHFHILSLSLPFLLADHLPVEMAHTSFPYLFVDANKDLSKFSSKRKIGIAWEAGPPTTRSCPLNAFSNLMDENTLLFCLQKEVRMPELTEGCEDFELYGTEIDDFLDTAAFMKEMNYVVTVDTCILHLAGALNVPTFLLLADTDGRYGESGYKTRWYHRVRVYRNHEHEFSWHKMLSKVKEDLMLV